MTRRSKFMCKNFLLLIAAVCLGLLFYCIVSEAASAESDTLYLMPEAGFTEFIDEIEPVDPEIHEHEMFEEPIEPTYYISDEDADLLLRLAPLEGGEGDIAGMAHVMQVVLNRVDSDEFPNSISEVIFQTDPVQFTTADKLATANITPEAYAALDAVIFGDYQDNDCLFFESCEGLAFEEWADYSFSYGGHDFYKVKEGVV